MANKKTTNTNRTPAQIRSAAKPSKADRARVWAAWAGLPCAWCLLPMYHGTDKTGRGAEDATMGHITPFHLVGTYNAPHVAPQCGACNKATRVRDCADIIAPAPDWRQVSAATGKAHADGFTPAARGTLPDEAARHAARKARLGW